MLFPRVLTILAVVALSPAQQILAAPVSAETQWQRVVSSDDSKATARHEASAVAVGDRLYLMGGRGNRPVEVFDTVTRTWQDIGRAPVDLHHFQPVVIGTNIYALGALVAGGFPEEKSEPGIHVLDTRTNTWSLAGQVPQNRRRGAAAAVVRDGKIYILGGNTNGHNGGAVAWLDRYDPATGDWTELPDAPNARDHFAAAVVDDKLVAAGGRRSTNAQNDVFANTVAQTDIYDFASNTWSQGVNIPTVRAGAMVASTGTELLVAGGEISGNSKALATVEAYSVADNRWRSLQDMIDKRHSGGAARVGSVWHVVAGSKTRGGGSQNELSSHETLDLDIPVDSDNDGLSDSDELAVYSTFPDDPDSDDDELNDGSEVQIGSDPRDSDTDDDTLTDGEEFNTHQSSPLLADTDDDGLSDDAEVVVWGSNPSLADTDNDGLDDGYEVDLQLPPTNAGTNPILPDTDEDGLSDGAEIIAGTNPLLSDTDDDGMPDGEDPEPLVSAKSLPKKKSGSMVMCLLLALGVTLAYRTATRCRQ